MEELQITAAVIGGILLRIGVPVAITFLVGSFLRKLDTRWREEAKQEAIEAQLIDQRQTLLNLWLDQPCHNIKNCSEEEMKDCQAALQTGQPCWESHRVNGVLAIQCQECEYRKELILALDPVTI
ncbi:MAG: hypothetical protein ABFS17_04190 [Chloroflexota bacterium]